MKAWYVFLLILYFPPLARIACQGLKIAIFIPRVALQLLSRNKIGKTKADSKGPSTEWIRLTQEGINRAVGIFEYTIRPLRNFSVTPILGILFALSLLRGVAAGSLSGLAWPLFGSLFFLLVTSYSVQMEIKSSLK